MAEETITTTLASPENQPPSNPSPLEESDSTQQVLTKENETTEKTAVTVLPEAAAEATSKPEEETSAAAVHHHHHPPKVTETETESTEKKELGDEASEKEAKIPQNLGSFKEESSKLSNLSDTEKKSLDELKLLVKDALNNHQFGSTTNPDTPEQVSIWGIPLLKDDKSDVVLLKFLPARDFKVKESLIMLKNTIKWRNDFKIDELVEEDLVDDLDKVVFMHGHDREGHPVCYNVYGEFQNKELYSSKTFSDEEKRKHFLRTRKLDFSSRSDYDDDDVVS